MSRYRSYNDNYYSQYDYQYRTDPREQLYREFTRRYRIKLIHTREQYERTALDYNLTGQEFQDIPIKRERVCEIELKEQDLERLMNDYRELQLTTRELDRLERQHYREADLRKRFPAAAKAYENYQMMLALVGQDKENNK